MRDPVQAHQQQRIFHILQIHLCYKHASQNTKETDISKCEVKNSQQYMNKCGMYINTLNNLQLIVKHSFMSNAKQP